MKVLARKVRSEHGIASVRVLRSDLRRVYRAYGIKLDLRSGFKQLRGAYFFDGDEPSVVIDKTLPEDPRVFTMAHELKHHLVDRDSVGFQCDFTKAGTDPVEIGAEVFAAELLFPEREFHEKLTSMGVHQFQCTAQHLVQLKHETRTTLSYQGLAKRAEFMRFASPGSFAGVQFRKLEEITYGKPYRRPRRAF